MFNKLLYLAIQINILVSFLLILNRFPQVHLYYPRIQRTLQRVRRSVEPRIPRDAAEADEILRTMDSPRYR